MVALHKATATERAKSARWTALIGLVVLIIAASVQPSLGPFPGLTALLPVGGSVLLLAQPVGDIVNRLMGSKTLLWVGALSYSLYLWHWPVLALLRYYSSLYICYFAEYSQGQYSIYSRTTAY